MYSDRPFIFLVQVFVTEANQNRASKSLDVLVQFDKQMLLNNLSFMKMDENELRQILQTLSKRNVLQYLAGKFPDAHCEVLSCTNAYESLAVTTSVVPSHVFSYGNLWVLQEEEMA